jgi:hypothetical protein
MQPVSETPLVIAPRRIMPNRFFAVPDQARRDRRPTDITMLVTSIVVVAVLATRVSNPVGRFERALSDLAAALPEFLDPVWAIGADTVKVWAAILVVVAFAAKRGGLLRDLAVGAVLSFGAGMGVGRLVNGSWPDISNGLFSSRPAVDFPILGFALGVSVRSFAGGVVVGVCVNPVVGDALAVEQHLGAGAVTAPIGSVNVNSHDDCPFNRTFSVGQLR